MAELRDDTRHAFVLRLLTFRDFDVENTKYDLCRNGRRVRLARQPMDLLVFAGLDIRSAAG